MKCDILLMTFIQNVFFLQRIISKDHDITPDKPCVFPATYEGNKIDQCIYSKYEPPNYEPMKHLEGLNGYWWCSTTSNYDYYKQWKVCEDTGSTFGGNDPGQKCVFPFRYQGRNRLTCVRELKSSNKNYNTNSNEEVFWWCSTTSDFDQDKKWTICRPELSHLLPCHFKDRPTNLEVGGIVKSLEEECQPLGNKWVCKTEKGLLRSCPTSVNNKIKTISSSEIIRTEGGNDPDNTCHFPFKASLSGTKAQKIEYSTCIPASKSRQLSLSSMVLYPQWLGSWCATTADFDRDGLWTRCLPEVVINQAPYLTLASIYTRLNWLHFANSSIDQQIPFSYKLLSNIELIDAITDAEYVKLESEVVPTPETCSMSLDWFVWFMPLWSILYNLNLKPPNISSSPQSTFAVSDQNPMDRALQMPPWFKEMSTHQGWVSNEVGYTMQDRWRSMRSSILHRWLIAISVSAILGFLSCIGIVFGIYMCYNRSQSKREKYNRTSWTDETPCRVYEEPEEVESSEGIHEVLTDCAECSCNARDPVSQECTFYSDSSHSMYRVRPTAPPSYEEITSKKSSN